MNSSLFTIELEGLRFFAPHGAYDGEALTGNEFEVGLQMDVDGSSLVKNLDETINYVLAYGLLRKVFIEREALLEVICQKAAALLEKEFPKLLGLRLRICKLTPAIERFSGRVCVTFSKSYAPA